MLHIFLVKLIIRGTYVTNIFVLLLLHLLDVHGMIVMVL